MDANLDIPMSVETFESRLARVRLDKSHLFDFERVPPSNNASIAQCENSLGAQFPAEYWHVASRIGGGQIGYGHLFVPTDDEHWSILRWNAVCLTPSFIAISDNGCGDYYGFVTSQDGACDSKICLVDHEQSDALPIVCYQNLYEFMVIEFLRDSRDPVD